MAQSQEPITYDRTLLEALDNTLSPSRMAPYLLLADNDPVYAHQLYLWNARLAKSFLYPLGVVEVAVRNSMHKALSEAFGTTEWVISPNLYYTYFTPESLASHGSSKRRLTRSKGRTPNPDEMVAGLNFDFWSNILRPEYMPMWLINSALGKAFPLMEPAPDLAKARLAIADVNHLRNRIAHHEPIHHLDIRARMDLLHGVMGFVCKDTAGWMKECSTVMQTLRTVPSKVSSLPGPQLSSTNIRPPIEFLSEAKVTDILAAIWQQRPQVIAMRDATGEVNLITAAQVLEYIEYNRAINDGAVLLTDETIAEILCHTTPPLLAEIKETETTGDALAAFFPRGNKTPRPHFLKVMQDDVICGVIQNPIVKYQ
tara:strand:- start:137 stop:1246 length:1110 start_codon:yes stop_codon:yes gene_type:complete